MKIRIGENGKLPDIGERYDEIKYDENNQHHYILTYYVDGNFKYEYHYIDDKIYSLKYPDNIEYYDENEYKYLDVYTQDYGAQMEFFMNFDPNSRCNYKTHIIMNLLSKDLPYDNFERLNYELRYTNNEYGWPIQIEAYTEDNFRLMTGIYTYDENGKVIDTHWYGANGKEWTFDLNTLTGDPIEIN